MPTTNAAFCNWLKGSNNIKLSSDAAVFRLTDEGITDFNSFLDFDRYSIEALSKACSMSIEAVIADVGNNVVAEPAVPGVIINSLAVQRLVIAMRKTKYYDSIRHAPTEIIMHYNNALKGFKEDYDTYALLRKQDSPEAPVVNDKDKEKRIIKRIPLFKDCLSRTFRIKGLLIYVLREDVAVPSVADDPLDVGANYGTSGSLMEELIKRLPHTGYIFKDNNKTVFMMISKSVAGIMIESTIKSFSRQKDGRGAFQAIVANHAGDTKYCTVAKSRMNLLQKINWNSRSYPLEKQVSNHRTALDDLEEYHAHIGTAVPNQPQRVEYLLESIACQDTALQAAMGNVRDESHGLRTNFENASSHLIEVDPYRQSSCNPTPVGKSAHVSSVIFAGCVNSGVDLRWHTRKEFLALSSDQKDELIQWKTTPEGKTTHKKQRNVVPFKKRKRGDDRSSYKESDENGNWKRKLKKAMKTPSGLSHIMSVLLSEEQNNAHVSSFFQPPHSQQLQLPPIVSSPLSKMPPGPPPQAGTISQLAAAFLAL